MMNKEAGMKIVSLEIKKIELKKFIASKQQLELGIIYDDGNLTKLIKNVDSSDPEKSAQSLISDIKARVHAIHKEKMDSVLGQVNLVVKREVRLKHEIALFLSKANKYLQQINNKKDAAGYLDIVRELKNLKIEFSDQ